MTDHIPATNRTAAPSQSISEKESASSTLLSGAEQQFLAQETAPLLGSSYTQWQFGEWAKLASLKRADFENQPGRAQLALLAAASRAQVGDHEEAIEFIELAKTWGIDERICVRVLVSGAYNSLGRAFAALEDQERSKALFSKAIKTGCPEADHSLLSRARYEAQREQIKHLAPPLLAQRNTEQSGLSESNVSSPLTQLRALINQEVAKAAREHQRNPYTHNRTLTEEHNAGLVSFAEQSLKLTGIRPKQIDYLAGKALQIERLCVGRLATTIQDAVCRQLVVDCLKSPVLSVLEIGALYGVSLAILYNHASTKFESVEITCLDPFDGYYGVATDAVLNQEITPKTFSRNMELAQVPKSDYHIIQHYSTEEAALPLAERRGFNLLVIDGDHTYEGVKFDFENYFPLLAPGGYVIFDDYNAPEWPGVQQFVDNDLQSYPGFEYLGFYSRTAVGRSFV
ncbi:class I SAM-dependent methyltransferase [Luminiphilus sp.]|nr:class I SAM-dependent methyltransferase [Luminiphilus sp.]MDA9711246.1 class I SAM-dependent methyltransferase [Luminiphilus sp.]